MNSMTLLRYLRLFSIATAFSSQMLMWIRTSINADSPGGYMITAEEWIKLADVFGTAILEATGQAVQVLIQTEGGQEDEV